MQTLKYRPTTVSRSRRLLPTKKDFPVLAGLKVPSEFWLAISVWFWLVTKKRHDFINQVRGLPRNYRHPPPFWRFGHWNEIKKLCSWQSEEGRLNWYKKRESRPAVSKHEDRGGFRAGLWSTADVNCTHSINQSINQSIENFIVV